MKVSAAPIDVQPNSRGKGRPAVLSSAGMDDRGRERPDPGSPPGGSHGDSWAELAEAEAAPTDPNVQLPFRPSLVRRIGGLGILVVDDDPARLDAIAGELRELGARVSVGDTEASGYRQAIRAQPDLILSDLITPNDRGWWLIQRLRRQPLLRWTPVLLMRWWEKTDGGDEVVRVGKVVERVEEILAPVRVLEERIAANRALSDRVETTGVPALLRMLSAAGLSGVLTLNDSWSVFEAGLRKGRLVSVVRRGVGGEADEGEDAFLQLLLCDEGRWSFRHQDATPQPLNVERDLAECSARASRLLASMIGPEATFGPGAEDLLRVRTNVLEETETTFSGLARQLVKGVSAGISSGEVGALVVCQEDVVAAERLVFALLRRGAVSARSEPWLEPAEPAGERAARSAAALLGRIAADHRSPDESKGRPEKRGARAEAGRDDRDGTYRLSTVEAERVAVGTRAALNVPGIRARDPVGAVEPTGEERSSTTPISVRDSSAEEGREAPSAGARGRFPDDTPVRGSAPAVLPRDSFAPSPEPAGDRNRHLKWLALLLALALGGVVAAGLVAIASDDRPPPARTD